MAYTQQEIDKIYKELQAMSNHTGRPMMSLEELTSYLQSREPGMETQLPENGMFQETKSKIKNMMLEDLGGAEALGDVFNDLKDANEKEMKQLREQANQKELKAMKAMERQAIKDAQNTLKGIHDRQISAEAKRSGFMGHGRQAYAPAEERKQHTGRSYWNPLHFMVSGANFGTHDERHSEHHTYQDKIYDTNGIPVPVNSKMSKSIECETKEGVLKGHQYVPSNPNGKVVLYFGGSGDPACRYLGKNTAEYLKHGATVVSFDPRGFGQSMSKKNGKQVGTNLSEESMYADAKEMYDYVINKMGVKPENVILHGFSMGGAVASRLAADISEKNQVLDTKLMKEQGKHIPESMRLGGIVLQSPMSSNYDAAKRMFNGGVFGSAAGFLAWAGGGGFNTKSHMERLHKFDPNIPVHYTGGKPSTNPDLNDHLSIEITGVHTNPKAQFSNASVFTQPGDHYCGLSTENPFIAKLAMNGRHAELAPNEPEIAEPEVKGPEKNGNMVL